mgnify:CR=1 FL=1
MCGCSSGRFRRKGRRACEKATGAETVPAGRGQPLIVYGGLCLLPFDTERMGYAALYGGGEQFFFVDAAVFKSTGGDLYAISGVPYLMGVSGSSALYALDGRLRVCALPDCGVEGEMFSVRWLPDAQVLLGGVYENGAFQLYVIDPAQLLIESPVIRRKLRLMCGAVRDNFDTTGWGQVRWESLL